MARPMLELFEKYWSDHSMILSFDVLLDPRYKLQLLKELYNVLYVEDEVQMRTFDANLAASRSGRSDVDSYISLPIVPHTGETEFDILDYWKNQSISYPVLSHMTRDILAIPITSVASESSFSMGGCLLNRSNDAAELVESITGQVENKSGNTNYLPGQSRVHISRMQFGFGYHIFGPILVQVVLRSGAGRVQIHNFQVQLGFKSTPVPTRVDFGSSQRRNSIVFDNPMEDNFGLLERSKKLQMLTCNAIEQGAEMWGVYAGLLCAWNARMRKIIIEFDSLDAIRLLSNRRMGNSSLTILKHIYVLMDRQWEVRFQHVLRHDNRITDSLASRAGPNVIDTQIWLSPLDEMINMFNDDNG
ncbi:hypothetical protein F3Y22_tig00112383pilonHSYRG00541 [Hibiscus syriacus]|uniref:HAT C-terminal dimerisation domain-containing protein n=1 Tax=Hibiscus syriacus TaxID=106335 RepID=A0A6A2Y8M7_HIBSY|nr:hypothetical protein F3Y22_tig00112383pilonHSYRG00541 [Hibiscus syriacus]